MRLAGKKDNVKPAGLVNPVIIILHQAYLKSKNMLYQFYTLPG